MASRNADAQTRWRKKNPEKARANVEYVRDWRRKRLESIAGRIPTVCEACGSKPDGRWGRLNFDHDHETGEFRGWLCRQCNIALGLVKDNAERLLSLALYLERHKRMGK
jgi:hypothetical protein